MNTLSTRWLNKVPEVTLAFWIIKVMSTTVGETFADFLAVDVGWGLGITSAVMALLLIGALVLQMRKHAYEPWIYWLSVVLVSILGTQITDILTDVLDVSLYTSTAVFSLLLVINFAVWYALERNLSIRQIVTPRRELFYWSTVLCTFALGTAGGDLATEALGLGFGVGTLIFGALIAGCLIAWRSGINTVLVFWVAYVLTRPLGASLGDLLTQSREYGGLGMGATWTSAIFLCVIFMLVGVAQIGAVQSKRLAP
ncbi:COG4705 family protein [Pseudomonas putida]|uniref:COG4705 family protein n=1 Tax=Pseudomonas TaxID=286 RepID=UPI003467AD00